MGVARWLAVILFGAGSVLMVAGVAAASTDPEVEREEAASTSSAAVPTTLGSTTTSAAMPTTLGSTTTNAETTSTTSTTTVVETTTTVTTSTTTTVPATGDAEQVPTFYLRGLCATPNSFIFAMSNLGTAPVAVELVFNGQPFDTVDLDPGEVYGFRTAAPGTMVANLPGASFQTESVDAPCPVEPGSIGLGGLCRDDATGFQWLLGNAGPDPVDVEVRLNGATVGTFTVESGGFAGFTTMSGGEALALVAGSVVADALSSDSPCTRGPASLFAQCFSPGQGFRWFVSNDEASPLTGELRVAGVVQAVVVLGPFEASEVTTAGGGLGELVVGGEVVASAASSSVLCESGVGLFSFCSDAASGALWGVGNDSPSPVQLRLVVDGADAGTVSLAPGEQRTVTTAESARIMEAYQGSQLMASAERSTEPCVSIRAVCADPIDGQVWEVAAARVVTVEVRVGAVSVAVVDLSEFQSVQVVSPQSGLGQVLIDGTVVDEAAPTSDGCVAFVNQCFDPALGYVVQVANLRDRPATVELRVDGIPVASAQLGPYEGAELVSPVQGTGQLYLHGASTFEFELSDGACELSISLFGTCIDDASGAYGWEVFNNRMLSLTVELRLEGVAFDRFDLEPFGTRSLSSSRPGTMQAFVNGVFVTEAPSPDTFCSGSPAASPGRLPGTGAGPGGPPALLGLACLAAGLVVLAASRRRDHRTPVRS
jgi:hypothetical protein